RNCLKASPSASPPATPPTRCWDCRSPSTAPAWARSSTPTSTQRTRTSPSPSRAAPTPSCPSWRPTGRSRRRPWRAPPRPPGSSSRRAVRFTVYTLFPGLVTPYLEEALLARAVREGIVGVEVRDLRRFAGNRTGRVDDAPYGGGAGMVVRVDVAAAAIDEAAADDPPPDEVVLLTPAGERLTQGLVAELATKRHVCLLAARYEGFDARVESLVTREVSIGDFVLMGGELPALCVIEAVTRLLPGALGDEE